MKILFTLSCALALLANTQALAGTRAENLKAQISELARSNMERTDNWPEIRGQLDALIAELNQEAGSATPEDVIQFGGGSWQQVWSDESNPEPPGFARVWPQIFQVVTPFGYGYNFGVRKAPWGDEITFILRVKVGVEGTKAIAEITDAFSRPGRLQLGEDLYGLALAIEAGTAPGVEKRESGRFPNGPIGAKGEFQTLFVDHALKVGIAPNSYSGKPELFVMERKAGPQE
jgi:hypothetical protein